jgi:hypothetical protein
MRASPASYLPLDAVGVIIDFSLALFIVSVLPEASNSSYILLQDTLTRSDNSSDSRLFALFPGLQLVTHFSLAVSMVYDSLGADVSAYILF